MSYEGHRRQLASRRPRRRKRRSASTGLDVLGAVAIVFAIAWYATPSLKIAYHRATLSSDELAARERSAYYRDCSDARSAGAAPIHAGEPGYRPELDGDLDGIACEPFR